MAAQKVRSSEWMEQLEEWSEATAASSRIRQLDSPVGFALGDGLVSSRIRQLEDRTSASETSALDAIAKAYVQATPVNGGGIVPNPPLPQGPEGP